MIPPLNRVIRQNAQAFNAAAFLANLDFTLPIYALFGKNFIGISYTQVSLIITVMYVYPPSPNLRKRSVDNSIANCGGYTIMK
jgi:hypothetical protein